MRVSGVERLLINLIKYDAILQKFNSCDLDVLIATIKLL